MKYKTISLLSGLLIMAQSGALAQFQLPRDVLMKKLDEGLATYLVKVYPHHFCEDNKSKHTYMGDLSISKVGVTAKVVGPNRFEDRLMVWGTARVDYHNGFVGGSTKASFIAQFRNAEPESPAQEAPKPPATELVKLKWKKNDCMQYATLLDLEENEPDWWAEQETKGEAERLDWALEAYRSEEMGEEASGGALEREQLAPLEFLEVYAELSSDAVGAGDVQPMQLQGEVLSLAQLTTYKDAVLKLTYFSKTQSVIASEQWTLYEFFRPGESISFMKNVQVPAQTASFSLDILTAIPTQP